MAELLNIHDLATGSNDVSHLRCIDEKQLSECLHVEGSTLRQWRMNGSGPKFLKLGSGRKAAVRYRVDDVAEWLEKNLKQNTV